MIDATRTRIVTLAEQGTRPCLIQGMLAERVFMYEIYAAIKAARASGKAIPPFDRTPLQGVPRGQLVYVEPDILTLLDREASRRQVDVKELARRLLTIAAEEDMIAAILDDGERAA
jgi:hypothetical protein